MDRRLLQIIQPSLSRGWWIVYHQGSCEEEKSQRERVMGFIHVVGTEFAGSNQLSFSEHTNFGGADLLLGSELTFGERTYFGGANLLLSTSTIRCQ